MNQWANIIRHTEMEQGFKIIWSATWLNVDEWHEFVISEDHEGRIRLVLLDARIAGEGAFTRLISGIQEAGLIPVIVEPTGRLAEWCKKHGWRKRLVGRGTQNVHEIWYQRR